MSLCVHCGEGVLRHNEWNQLACRIIDRDDEWTGWHPTNRFTPRAEGEQLEPPPYFTMKRSEWVALGPKGQAAMVEVVKAVTKAYHAGALPDALRSTVDGACKDADKERGTGYE